MATIMAAWKENYNNRKTMTSFISDDDDDDDEDDFMMRIVHNSCQGVFPINDAATGQQCHVPQCHFPDHQLDLLMHCRHPSTLLAFFHTSQRAERRGSYVMEAGNGSNSGNNNNAGAVGLPGAYVMPAVCEYCGATSTDDCDAQTCHRPSLYFQKKRPPFAHPDASKWDGDTDNAIGVVASPARQHPATTPSAMAVSPPTASSSSSATTTTPGNWVSGFFGKE